LTELNAARASTISRHLLRNWSANPVGNRAASGCATALEYIAWGIECLAICRIVELRLL
jgi:hypothetical protein